MYVIGMHYPFLVMISTYFSMLKNPTPTTSLRLPSRSPFILNNPGLTGLFKEFKQVIVKSSLYNLRVFIKQKIGCKRGYEQLQIDMMQKLWTKKVSGRSFGVEKARKELKRNIRGLIFLS